MKMMRFIVIFAICQYDFVHVWTSSVPSSVQSSFPSCFKTTTKPDESNKNVIPYYMMNGVLALGAVVLLTLAVAAYCRGKLSGKQSSACETEIHVSTVSTVVEFETKSYTSCDRDEPVEKVVPPKTITRSCPAPVSSEMAPNTVALKPETPVYDKICDLMTEMQATADANEAPCGQINGAAFESPLLQFA